MFSYLNGRITDIFENQITLDVGGVGYEVTVSALCLTENNSIDKQAKIYIYMSVREDGVSLYGFSSKVEKSMFLRLLTVSGIGPKVAINILSNVSLNDLASSVASGDVVRLSSVKGIGKKTAERIILELKDKFSAEISIKLPNVSTMSDIMPSNDDAVMALVSLGYTKAEAVLAVSKVKGENLTCEQIVFKALKG